MTVSRHSVVSLACAALVGAPIWAVAQPAPASPAPIEAPTPEMAEPEAPTPEMAEPETYAPPPQPPMPAADEDFSVDKDLFHEVETAPEQALKAQQAVADSPALGLRPTFERTPRIAVLSQVIGGLFGALTVGLVGGRLGDAIDPGDPNEPLGGLHGAAVGAILGSAIGSSLGGYGAARLFEKDASIAWTAAGSGAGTLVGGGAMLLLATSLEAGDRADALSVSVFLGLQVIGTVLLPEYGPTLSTRHIPPTAPQALRRDAFLSKRATVWSFPLLSGPF